MIENNKSWKHWLLGIGLALLTLDLVAVNVISFSLLQKSPMAVVPEKTDSVTPAPLSSTGAYLVASPSAEVELSSISFDTKLAQTATSSLTYRVEQLEKKLVSQSVSTSPTVVSSAKEYYIPLGTGSTSSTDWASLLGVEAYVVPSNYGKIVAVYFEAGLRTQNGDGRVYARLLNVTDNVGLVESEVYREGNSPGLVSSGKIPIPTQTKLFRVQLKSALGSQVILDNARIKLFVE